MEVAVVMIDKKESSNVRRERWQSLLKCTHFSTSIFKLAVIFHISLISFLDSKYFSYMSSDAHFCVSLTRAGAHKKQKEQQNQEESGTIQASPVVKTATALADQDQRKTLKFGFSAKGGQSKVFVSWNSLFGIKLLLYYFLLSLLVFSFGWSYSIK